MIEPDNLGALPDGVLCQQQKAKVSTDISMNSTFPKVFIAGHRGMVGSAIYRHLINSGLPKDNLITRNRLDLDLTCQQDVNRFFEANAIDQVYLAAAKVGGIHANNTYPAEFIYENLMIQANIINATYMFGVKRLLFLGSSCIYPRDASQPMVEEELLTGALEPTNEPYAIAKIAGIKLCESYNRQYGDSDNLDFRALMPTNLYGPGDNYHSENSHVIPALIRRFHEAKISNQSEVQVWGSGKPKREFLFVEDLARASVHLMNLRKEQYQAHTTMQSCHINVGSGTDISIAELANLIRETSGFEAKIAFDSSMPDGTPRKLLNCDRMDHLVGIQR